MKNGETTVVIDGLWGDGGKGKIGAHICHYEDYDCVVRAGTGTNAGHSTQLNAEEELRTNQLPVAGILTNFRTGKLPLLAIGSGVCVNPDVLVKEIEQLKKYKISERIIIDEKCPVIEPRHIEAESKGAAYSEGHTGSTKSGTGACRMSRVERTGLLARQVDELKCLCGNVAEILNRAYDNGEKILIEGTQGHFLSLYLSPEYPVVTSDNCTVSAFIDDVGLAWNRVDQVCMIVKSAPTRVSQGCGNLPGEISKEEILRRGIAEYGVTTGRLRRKTLQIPFDLIAEAVMINQPTYFALTFCDHVDQTFHSGCLPDHITREDLKAYPKTYANLRELEKRFGVPVKYIDYGKLFTDITVVVD